MFELMPFDRRTNRMMNRFFGDFDREGFVPAHFGFNTDIKDNGESVLLSAELPGFNKEDISIDVANDTLTVKAERCEDSEEKNDSYIRRERRSGSFSRSFDITGIDPENIKAAYNNGVLELTLPKLKEKEPEAKRIAID